MTEIQKRHLRTFNMLAKGQEFAKYLPNHVLLGVDPGYLFTSTNPRDVSSLDMSENVLDTLLEQLRNTNRR